MPIQEVGDGMGLRVEGYNIALDTHEPDSDVNFVSHAHSDHTSGIRKGKKNIVSDATKDLIEARKRTTLDTLPIPGCVKLLNSGHMLGAKQLHVSYETEGYSVLYSGDYQMQRSSAAEPIETAQADVLIIDSTYPYPNIEFEPRDETITAIQHYAIGKLDYGVTLFGAYTMGKAQELIKVLNEGGIAPFVSKRIGEIAEVYRKHGIALDYLVYESQEEMIELSRKVSVGIMDVNKLDIEREAIASKANRRVFTASATGFAKMFKFSTDVQFALSDHADFKQAVEYIGMCNPKLIYTCGSGAVTFAKNLSAIGFNAHPVKSRSSLANSSFINISKL